MSLFLCLKSGPYILHFSGEQVKPFLLYIVFTAWHFRKVIFIGGARYSGKLTINTTNLMHLAGQLYQNIIA